MPYLAKDFEGTHQHEHYMLYVHDLRSQLIQFPYLPIEHTFVIWLTSTTFMLLSRCELKWTIFLRNDQRETRLKSLLSMAVFSLSIVLRDKSSSVKDYFINTA